MIRGAFAVLKKDLRCEFRARQAVSAVLMFAVTSCVAVSFTLQDAGKSSTISSALLWLVIYFSAMTGLSRSFVREEETGTSAILKLAACPISVYLGKLAFNWILVIAIQVTSVPLLMVFMGLDVIKWPEFIAILALGGLGLSVGATTAAAMVSKAATRGAVFAVICFPLLVPALAAAVHGSNAAMSAGALVSSAMDIKLLASYCGTVITASIMLFKFIWED